MRTDIRWIQRLSNYSKALIRLGDALRLAKERPLTDLEKQGMIQAFEFTHELAWNTIKDFYENQGESSIQGSRDAARLAFRRGLIDEGAVWMEMIKSRNQTSHTYNEKIADTIVASVTHTYFDEFKALEQRLNQLKEEE